jgi:hypothetical protein
MNVYDEVMEERERQKGKGYSFAVDDSYSAFDWHEMISDYNGWARRMWAMGSTDKARRRLIQVAALALAAVEAIDRRFPLPPSGERGEG